MTDRLAPLLKHYTLRAEVFHTGAYCDRTLYDGPSGYLHLLRGGALTVTSALHPPLHLDRPCCLLYPRSAPHTLITPANGSADLICARIQLDAVAGNPLANALPDVLHLPLETMPALRPIVELLIDEAAGDACGRQASLDRLSELLLIQLLRHLLDARADLGGLLAGLAEPRLARALTAMHDAPATPWTLDTLARTAGMSRARFAAHFKQTVGVAPAAYLAAWRIALASVELRRGKPLPVVANAVGYGSATALARAFRAHTGQSPRESLR